MDAKICGVRDTRTLRYILNHQHPPRFIGFICNYPKSKRHLNFSRLKKIIGNKKKGKIKFVSVLVDPSDKILNKIKSLNFDYFQLYGVNAEKTIYLKKKFKIKIITAITVENMSDVLEYKKYKKISDIILFDSKGYEKSLNFNHDLLKNIPNNISKMIAGNIKYNDRLDKLCKITDIIDISGSLETKGKKDIKKIDIFLKNVNKI
ncbi:MAG: N-(5'-phosphoribosyl)anthranilate isomerase [Candidatus Pelagibacter sp.]|nr:N-(5'-phosphoribosyl)anthranilate isomerase [Candidatus Pelagibacter sp.]|tara:strand:+ start:1052 stop:1666 length:615 start_codon:yes stop_codon:yes gene_type:complete